MARVLIIEDERHVARLLGFFLTRAGYLVAEAADGEQALRLLDEFQPDAVLLDLILPKISGTEVLVNLLSRECALPVIVMTACPDDHIPPEIARRTDIPRFSKPVLPATLLRRLHDLNVPPLIEAH